MTTFLMGREIPLRGPDARIRLSDSAPGHADYFRLERMLLCPTDALNLLRESGFCADEAGEYLACLPTVLI